MKRYALFVAFFATSILSFSQVPTNDICADAITLTVNGGYVSANNSNTVTNAANPSCGGSTAIKDIWYKFVYGGGTTIIETQLGTNTDTRIAIYSACGGTQLACNDDYGGTYRSYISLTCPQLTIGNTYYIQAGGYNAVVGAFTIQVTSSGILGCTDPMATNYSACAATNDGSCIYPVLTAQFNYAPTGTNCLNVQYTSTSSGNITGYTWSFPGGSPSASNLQNPVVTYPAGGTYSATLTITDAVGSDSETNNSVLVTTGDIVTVDITPDANPTQTSWKMFDNLGVVVAQGTSNDATFCINSTCHKFEIYDSGSNGLSGAGNYRVYLNGVQVANGAAFGSKDIRDINCPEGTSCNNTLDAVLGVNDVPFDNSWYVFTPAETGQYRISTCGLAACDTRIWIYDYCVMANFDNTVEATYTYNDDFCGVQAQSDVFLAGGDVYYVRVGSAGACAGSSYNVLFEYVGPVAGCMDVLACNFNPLASVSGVCYYNGDPNCSGLGPDLEIDGGQLFSSLVAATMNGTDACLVNEGCLQGLGNREILKFTTRIANIGTQDYFIGVPNAANPQFVFDGCHNHYHYAGYAEYLLYDQTGTPMPQIGFKNGFCVLDLSCPSGISAQYGCGNMGITAGCADIYSSSLSCQWIDVTDVPAGDYYLVVRTNWAQAPDANGRYELRYDNNWAQVCIHFDRNPTTGALTGFTKNVTTCPIIEDCIGVPFGDNYPDCANNCPGMVKRGDVNNDTFLNPFDEHLYGEAAVLGGVTVTPCSDLNSDGEITVADASYVADCIHQQADLGVNPMLYEECPWDPEFWDPNDNATLGITNLNTTEQYFDVYIINPVNEVYALQVDFSGVVLSSVQNLLANEVWFAHPHIEVGGNSICATSEIHTKIPISVTPRSILRVYYSSMTGSTVCISNIIDVLNDFNHNMIATIGDCQSTIPGITADFTASQTSICSGQSVDFTDSTTGGPTAWSWSFPGGTPSTSSSQNPSVTYAAAGIYDVTLVATGPGGSGSEVKTGYISVGSSVQWFLDSDNDGFGSNTNTVNACVAPNGFVAVGGDCNNSNAAIFPGAAELCNTIDDDCDASIDEGFDLDGDGYTSCDGDCNDANALAYPGAFEICNAADEDCDGLIDEGYDLDGDGFTVCNGDCNDNDLSIYPGAIETCNGNDDNCNGNTDEGFDVDGDGFTSCNGDCNDNNASVYPGATETCNGSDDNCNGNTDEGFDIDGDGFTSCNGDCNDNNININPEASELCNGNDDDCDGATDEGFDNDGDGYTSCNGDCNDANGTVNPGAAESCNGIDDNCNASIDEGFDADNDGYTSCGGDCNDANSAIHPGVAEICNGIDEDCDATIDEGFDTDGDGFTTCSGDCDDGNASIYPGATEFCNNVDDDCNGLTDEGYDVDNDGYTSCNGDCNDNNNAVNPAANEACNGFDDDCDGAIDENLDMDGDGFTNCNGDCNDNNPAIYPGASELCNDIDDNCNSLTDEGFDLDGDGISVCQGDCNDGNGNISPAATEVCNLIDDNCDGLIDEGFDLDGDGFTACNGDCNDGNAAINPAVSESCNSIDDDCDGATDEGFDVDGDGFTSCNGDCNDGNASVYPGAIEICNNADDDCDGSVDEGFDADNDGFTSCNGDCDDSNSAINPNAIETCNGVDENCNEIVDEGAGPLYYVDADGDGYGNPSTGINSCQPIAGRVTNGLDCFDNNANRNPLAIELCNGIDDDCDGAIDDNCSNVVNDFYANAVTLSVAPYNTCTTISGTLSGATVSPESDSPVLTGQDVWYKFVATAPGVRIRVLTNTSDALIELQNSAGTMLDFENIQAIKGNESLNYGSLTIGETYYIAVRNNNSALGTGTFSICLTALPNTSCGTNPGPFSLCSTFKATSTSAQLYVFNFTSLTNGSVYTRTQSSVNCVLNTVAGLPLGHTFTVRIDAVYSVSLGNSASEQITIIGPTTCAMTTSPDPALFLRDNQTCPAARAMNSLIRTNTTICAISNYGWEFQVSNLSQPAFYVNSGTAYTTTLSAAAGFAQGTTYNVRIRPTYTNGYVGAWGPVRCMVIGTSSGMTMEDESDFSQVDEQRFDEANINLFPNPSKGDAINLMIDQVNNGEVSVQIFDGMGRSVWANRFIVDGYLNTQLTFDEQLSAGLYLVEVSYDGLVKTEKILIEK
jgi:PKD repeat protein